MSKKGSKRAKRHTTKAAGASKASKAKLLNAGNSCCPIIRVTSRDGYYDKKSGKAYALQTVQVGKKSRKFKDGYEAEKYVNEMKAAQDARRCRPVVDIVELPAKASATTTRYT